MFAETVVYFPNGTYTPTSGLGLVGQKVECSVSMLSKIMRSDIFVGNLQGGICRYVKSQSIFSAGYTIFDKLYTCI